VSARRRRGLLLFSVALASGGLAASEVQDREREVAEQVGEPVEVVVAARNIRAGARVTRGALALREVPARFVPPDALASATGIVGARTAGPLVAGAYVTPAALAIPNASERATGGMRRGTRDVTVSVAGGAALAGVAPGMRTDILVSTEPGADAGRTELALAGVELVRVGEAAPADYREPDAPPGGTNEARATLRVSLREAVYLTAADNFAREIRLLARPPGDRSGAGAAVSQADL
jgi:pilus assembly protein CpaB